MPPPVNQNPNGKSNLAQGLQNNLNSKETILHPANKDKIENPTRVLMDAYLGKKKKKNEDKERIEARQSILDKK